MNRRDLIKALGGTLTLSIGEASLLKDAVAVDMATEYQGQNPSEMVVTNVLVDTFISYHTTMQTNIGEQPWEKRMYVARFLYQKARTEKVKLTYVYFADEVPYTEMVLYAQRVLRIEADGEVSIRKDVI